MPSTFTTAALLALLLGGCDDGMSSEGTDADADGWTADRDCDDQDPTVHPGATEVVADGIDQNCDGGDTCYRDTDKDGYGSTETLASANLSCQDYGESSESTDCDDDDASAYPGAPEVVGNERDNDCDGGEVCYEDLDGDGYGTLATVVSTDSSCRDPGESRYSTDCDDGDADVLECPCTLVEVSTPTLWVSSESTWGQWMADPLETLGAGLYWEMDSYTGSTLVEYASLDDLVSRTVSGRITLPYSYDGTGAVVYDGYLYYNQASTNNLVKYDIATDESETLTLTGAGYHNTYDYQWGGYSDIDFAVDEEGLWVLYGTAANEGRMVISSLDPESFSVMETWETDSTVKTSVGNAFMICGIMYTVTSHSSSPTTIGYAYDTSESTSSTLSITWYNDYSYNSMIDYNPNDELIYGWDRGRRVTYTPTTE